MTEKLLVLLLAAMTFMADVVGWMLGRVREVKWRTWRRRVVKARARGEILLCGNCQHEMLPREVILWNRRNEPIHDEHTPHFTLQNSTRIYCRFGDAGGSGDYDEVGVESGWHTQANKVHEPDSVRFSRVTPRSAKVV